MPIIFNDKVISGTVNGASVTYSKRIPHRHNYTVQGKWSGTSITGQMYLEASINGDDWIQIPDTVCEITSTGGNIWDVSDANYTWIRITSESTSGSITFEVWLEIKKASNIH